MKLRNDWTGKYYQCQSGLEVGQQLTNELSDRYPSEDERSDAYVKAR